MTRAPLPGRVGAEGLSLHATCVAFSGLGVLIVGPSGSGKSALGLQLMSMGAALVADDRTLIRGMADGPVASAPPGLPPLIEARGIGLLAAKPAAPARVVLIADLGAAETERLPPRRKADLGGFSVDVVHGPVTAYFPAAIRQYILQGRKE